MNSETRANIFKTEERIQSMLDVMCGASVGFEQFYFEQLKKNFVKLISLYSTEIQALEHRNLQLDKELIFKDNL
jgi:hypothetical protein